MAGKKTNKASGRTYEYDTKYEAQPDQIMKRSSRNKARRKIAKQMDKKAMKGKDVSHKNGNPMDNRASNLKLESKAKNRARKK